MTRIFLIGYMGSGKTTIGKLLANRIGYSFIDMDKHIEEKEFRTIQQIFEEKGESEFRNIEKNCLHEVSQFENTVISTGGGAPCFFDNMEYMNTHGTTVYLQLTAQELAERLESSRANKRPLLSDRKGEDLLIFISEGLKKREPFYSQATFKVNGSIEYTVSKIQELTSTK